MAVIWILMRVHAVLPHDTAKSKRNIMDHASPRTEPWETSQRAGHVSTMITGLCWFRYGRNHERTVPGPMWLICPREVNMSNV